jgi:hypothetical protein
MFYTGELIPQWRGSFLFGTLRGTHLHRLAFANGEPWLHQGKRRLADLVRALASTDTAA